MCFTICFEPGPCRRHFGRGHVVCRESGRDEIPPLLAILRYFPVHSCPVHGHAATIRQKSALAVSEKIIGKTEISEQCAMSHGPWFVRMDADERRMEQNREAGAVERIGHDKFRRANGIKPFLGREGAGKNPSRIFGSGQTAQLEKFQQAGGLVSVHAIDGDRPVDFSARLVGEFVPNGRFDPKDRIRHTLAFAYKSSYRLRVFPLSHADGAEHFESCFQLLRVPF